jgi:hypothetical protein
MTSIDWQSLWRFLDYSGDQFSAVQSETLRAQFAGMSNNPVMPTLSPGGTDFTSVDNFRARGTTMPVTSIPNRQCDWLEAHGHG